MALAITLILFIVLSTTVNAITPSCNLAEDKALCSKMTKDAPTWAEAAKNAVNYQLGVVKSGQSIVYGIGSKLPENLEPEQKQDIIDTCNQLYNGLIENLKKAPGFIKKDPYLDAFRIAVTTPSFQGCIDEIGEVARIDAPDDVVKYNVETGKNRGVLLALAYSRPTA